MHDFIDADRRRHQDERAQRLLTRSLTRRELLARLALAGASAVTYSMAGAPLVAASRGRSPVSPAGAYSAEVALAWLDLVGQLVKGTPGYSPPVASRTFAYLGVALYEALIPGMPDHRSLVGQLRDLPSLDQASDRACHWPSVANRTLAALVRAFFPTAPAELRDDIDALEARITRQFGRAIPGGIRRRSILRGQRVAMRIFEWSSGDGGHESYLHNFPSDYVPPVGPGLWVPTPPGFQPALQPYWGRNRTFAIGTLSEADGGQPPPYSETQGSAFYAEGYEVYDTVNRLTPERTEIALFWSDDPGATETPPGHSVAILSQVLRQQGASLELAAEAYAKLGMAVADAFICCWDTKFRVNLLRPITYIQRVIDPAWGAAMPLVTPPFPEYTSGHSVQSGAAAEVLTGLFGTLAFTDHTHDERGFAPRTFGSFEEAAAEAGISRLYGGIHYRAAIERGLEQGKRVGQMVNDLYFRR
jgi:hypothetical protein